MKRSTGCLAVAAGVFLAATFEFYAIVAGLVGLFVCKNRKAVLCFLAATVLTFLASPDFVSGNFQGTGLVVRVLREDEDGTRALVRTNEGKILLRTSMSLLPGETIAFRGERKCPMPQRNLYGFDEEMYMRTLGARSKVYTDEVTMMDETIRTRLVRTVKARLAPLGENGKLLLHALFGYGGGAANSVRGVGLSHLLAASGLHVLILATILRSILALFPLTYKMRSSATILLLFFYVLVTGFPPSLVRAWIMASLALAAPALGFLHRAEDGLKVAWIVILLINPYALFSPSFLLSFAATAGILVLSPRFRALGAPVATTLGAGLGVFPVTLLFFGAVPVVTLAANLIAAPFFVFAFALTVVFLPFLGSFAGVSLLKIIAVPLDLFVALTKRFPNLALHFGKANATLVLAYGVLLWMAFSDAFPRVRFSRPVLRFLGASMLFLVLIQAVHTFFPRPVFYHVDIGQGDATVIRGRETMVIDTGGEGHGRFDSGEGLLFPFLRAIGTTKIDTLLLTHPDADHVENAIALFDAFRVQRLLVTEQFDDDPLGAEVLNAAKRKGVPVIRVRTGDVYENADGTFRFFTTPFSGNDGSIVTHVTTKGHTLLYPGDAEKDAETTLVRLIPPAQILHAGHHGSRTSSHDFFLDAVRPESAIVSAGRNNTYGHPHEETLARFDRRGVRTYRTDREGMIFVDENTEFPYTLRDRTRKNWVCAFMVIAMDLVIVWGFRRYGWTTENSLHQLTR